MTKIAFASMVFLLLLALFNWTSYIESVRAEVITVPDDYPTIQEAANNANEGAIVFVKNGSYPENLNLSKSLTLRGENQFGTTIQGAITISGGYYGDTLLRDVIVEKFTITSLDNDGIILEYAELCTIRNNRLINNDESGINLHDSGYNSIYNNTITNNKYGGVEITSLHNCSGNTLHNNTISNNEFGITFSGNETLHTVVHANSLVNNSQGIFIWVDHWDTTNTFYHNNMINPQQVASFGSIVSSWDNGYPSGGNYWSNYEGADAYSGSYQNETGSDGIGDSPYSINSVNHDRYPLMDRFQNIHDLAVTEVNPLQTTLYQGDPLNISVVVENEGDFPETFNTTVHANNTLIETRNTTLTRKSSTTLLFSWNTTNAALGNYTLTATVDPVPDEADVIDNTYMDGTITILKLNHDISVTNVTPSRHIIGQGYSLSMNVTVENQGDVVEDFAITAYANTSTIGTIANIVLTVENSTTVTFLWNTTAWPYGNYTVSAYVEPVPDETDIADNTYVDGYVQVKWPYDTTGDGYCGMADIIAVAEHFDTQPNHPRWNPVFDINADDYVGIDDIILVSEHFGESS